VRPGLLLWVLAREVHLWPHAPPLPGGQREVQGLLQRESTWIKAMVERVLDRWDAQRAGRLHDVYYGPNALVVLQREVA
jgi:hypothetical protein